jgi:hypothetical protein
MKLFSRLITALALTIALVAGPISLAQAAYVAPVTDSVVFDGHTLTVREFDPYASTMKRLGLGYNRVTIANGAVVTDTSYASAYSTTVTVTSSAWVHVRYWTPAGWTDYYRTFVASA